MHVSHVAGKPKIGYSCLVPDCVSDPSRNWKNPNMIAHSLPKDDKMSDA